MFKLKSFTMAGNTWRVINCRESNVNLQRKKIFINELFSTNFQNL